jgi:hypothetical protein
MAEAAHEWDGSQLLSKRAINEKEQEASRKGKLAYIILEAPARRTGSGSCSRLAVVVQMPAAPRPPLPIEEV